MIRDLKDAKAFRESRVIIDPTACYHGLWAEYGVDIWDFTTSEWVRRPVLLLCDHCGRTPEEITRP